MRREGLTLRQVPQILTRFAADREFWALVGITGDVLRAAEQLMAKHPLRALDAIHVASAQLFVARMATSDVRFVSADARQTAVAVDSAPAEGSGPFGTPLPPCGQWNAAWFVTSR